MDNTQKLIFCITLVASLAVQLDAVTVNQSLCPTNKIAPNRRAISWEPNRPRTLGLIYSLFSPGRPRPPINYQDELQAQEDDPDDCGEIEDYDETDLSSITPGASNKILNDRGSLLVFGNNYLNRPVQPPHRPSTSRPHRPTYPPTKPPYSSGGVFGSNVYRPQNPQYPSNYIKPVQENTYETYPQAAYIPGVVGGAIGHVVGYEPVKATSSERPNSNIRFPDTDAAHTKRPVRTEQTNMATGIIGSFVDLIFN